MNYMKRSSQWPVLSSRKPIKAICCFRYHASNIILFELSILAIQSPFFYSSKFISQKQINIDNVFLFLKVHFLSINDRYEHIILVSCRFIVINFACIQELLFLVCMFLYNSGTISVYPPPPPLTFQNILTKPMGFHLL